MTAPLGPFLLDTVQRHDDGVCTVTLTGDLEAVRSAGARLQEQVWIVTSDPVAEQKRIADALSALERDALPPLMVEGTAAARVVAALVARVRAIMEGGA